MCRVHGSPDFVRFPKWRSFCRLRVEGYLQRSMAVPRYQCLVTKLAGAELNAVHVASRGVNLVHSYWNGRVFKARLDKIDLLPLLAEAKPEPSLSVPQCNEVRRLRNRSGPVEELPKLEGSIKGCRFQKSPFPSSELRDSELLSRPRRRLSYGMNDSGREGTLGNKVSESSFTPSKGTSLSRPRPSSAGDPKRPLTAFAESCE